MNPHVQDTVYQWHDGTARPYPQTRDNEIQEWLVESGGCYQVSWDKPPTPAPEAAAPIVGNVLLAGVVGSTAYGLAGPDSDVDRLGVFAAPTVQLHGLHQPRESRVSTGPDVTYHEARKYCQLALNGNPSVTELLWLGEHETATPLGVALVGLRRAFPSKKRTRNAYLGYASGQFKRLEARGDGSFSADTRKRTAKHARHLLRLCAQGFALYATGELQVRVDDPQRYLEFGERVAGGDTDHARTVIGAYEDAFDRTPSVLPDQPDEAAVEGWLLQVRQAYL